MDLALNNLQRLICYKTQTTNQPSAEWREPPTSVQDMTLNNLMVRLQLYWSFGEC